MAKKILVITASPRSNGNSAVLASHIVKGAEASGANVEVVDVTELEHKVAGCMACDGCHPDKLRCVQEDDITDLVADFPNYDTIVLVTPVYFFGFPAQLKIVIDRLYSLLLHESGMIFSPLKRIKFAVAAVAGGNEEDSGWELIKKQMKYLQELIDGLPPKFLFRGNCARRDTVAGDAGFLKEAEEFGSSLGR
ncbi:MAG: flavodoxin family protein [Victivallaceae bacterium]